MPPFPNVSCPQATNLTLKYLGYNFLKGYCQLARSNKLVYENGVKVLS